MHPSRLPWRHVAALLLCAAPLRAQAILHVDASAGAGGDGLAWATAFADLQDALDAARADPQVVEVRVAAGSYRPDRGSFDPLLAFELVDGVALRGGYPSGGGPRDPAAHPTVLTGDLLGDDGAPDPLSGQIPGGADNSRHVLRGSDLGRASALDGFVVRGGRAIDGGFTEDRGGGAWLQGGAPVVRACRFERNVASSGAGLTLSDCAATVVDCRFTENRCEDLGGGLLIEGTRAATVRRCGFDDNVGGSGGGLALAPDAAGGGAGNASVVEDCHFAGNRGVVGATGGGGLYALRSTPDVRRCTFVGNAADGGGGALLQEGAGHFERCLFQDNEAGGDGGGALALVDFGFQGLPPSEVVSCAMLGNTGALVAVGMDVALRQCSLVGNRQDLAPFLQWPAVVGQSALVELANCIVWGNAGQAQLGDERDHLVALLPGAQTFLVTSSIIEDWAGVLPGTGSGVPPRFVDAVGPDGDPFTVADNDYRLDASSPARDAGDPAALPAGQRLDLDGRARVVDGDGDGLARVDLGAWEGQPVDVELLGKP